MDYKALGKILGEIYRIQRNTEGMACPVSQADIYGLLNGFEPVIKRELQNLEGITEKEINGVCNVLDTIFFDKEKMKAFKGYYDIEDQLPVDRVKAMGILTYLYANGSYVELIDKMNSERSPAECRTFPLSEFDK